MALKLVSDFVDFYDHAFSHEGEQFVRNSNGGPNRIDMFDAMFAAGLDVPKHGLVSDLYKDAEKYYENHEDFVKSSINEAIRLVVYTDLTAHRGEGKLLLTLEEANKQYPNNYASQYLKYKHSSNESESIRCQVVGDNAFWMRFESNDTWRSNCGSEIEITKMPIANVLYQGMENIHLPFYAIDFISPHGKHGTNNYTAIDFNVAPGLSGTPVEEQMTPKEIVRAIEDSMKKFRDMPL